MPSTNSNSRTAGVVLDAWKIAIFKRHLKDAGYGWVETVGPVSDTLLLQIPYETLQEMGALQTVLEAANAECRKVKLNSMAPPAASQLH